jgi:hypothetical protein
MVRLRVLLEKKIRRLDINVLDLRPDYIQLNHLLRCWKASSATDLNQREVDSSPRPCTAVHIRIYAFVMPLTESTISRSSPNGEGSITRVQKVAVARGNHTLTTIQC